jgi:hypothetical protein
MDMTYPKNQSAPALIPIKAVIRDCWVAYFSGATPKATPEATPEATPVLSHCYLQPLALAKSTFWLYKYPYLTF